VNLFYGNLSRQILPPPLKLLRYSQRPISHWRLIEIKSDNSCGKDKCQTRIWPENKL